MQRRAVLPFFLLSCFLALSGVSAQVAGPVTAPGSREVSDQYLWGMGYFRITEPRAPFVPNRDGRILFSYAPPAQARSASLGPKPTSTIPRLVQIAFEHENFNTLHLMARNEFGVFIALYNLDRPSREQLERQGRDLVYRLVVDGVWMADPVNPLQERKVNGQVLSRVALASLPPLGLRSPEISAEAPGNPQVVLRYQGHPGDEIFVGATFNAFDPYVHTMVPVPGEPGLFELTIRLRPGQYLYYFVVNGRRILDPLNDARGYNPTGQGFSRIDVPTPSPRP